MVSRIVRYFHIALIIILAISGLFGGIALMADPSGDLLQMPIYLIENTFLGNYFLPGLILFILLGLFPSIVALGLISRRKIKYINSLNIYKKRFWAWTYSLYSGIILVIWIDVQILLIGWGSNLQSIYAFLGVLIIIVTLLPQTIRSYKVKK